MKLKVPEAETLLETILARVKAAEGIELDRDVGVALGVGGQTVANWKARGTIPWVQLYEYAKRRSVSLDWLLKGTGEPFVGSAVAEPSATYLGRHSRDALYELAAQCHRALGERGLSLPPERFARLVRSLHRDMEERGELRVPYDRIVDRVELME